jgi:tRNA1(Val) A37 N6-methylase TrmN6
MTQSQSTGVINTQSKFENKINVNQRKDFGIYLTNNINTIDRILDSIDFEDNKLLSRKFLEPSCGNGVFLIRLLEKICEKIKDVTLVSNFIEQNIYFVDIDEKMVETTKKNINEFFKITFNNNFNGEYNAFIFDYTLRLKPKKNNSLFDTILKVPLSEFLGKMDYIIGNPPYVSLYGRRDRKKDEAQRIYYLNRYSQFPDTLKNGKINFVMLFIEQSIDLLKEDGILSFIIDLAFFETAYQHTRKYLLEKTKILSIEYNIKDFEVVSGQIIIKVQKGKAIENIVEIIDAETQTKINVKQENWDMPNDQYKFRFNTCADSAEIIKKINNKRCSTLKELYPKKNLRTCVMLLNMENLFVFEEKQIEKKVKIYPYYQGSKGLKGKYHNMEYSKYFHYDKELQDIINDELKEELIAKGIKNKKRLGLGEIVIYDNPKVYIRQSAKEIIASYDEIPSSANNSLYVFSLRDTSKQSITFLKFLCGLLNSELITFYAQKMNIIRFSKGKQPQIKTSDLYTIPIPTDIKLQKKISNIVDRIYTNKNHSEYIEEVDRLIFEYFQLSDVEISKLKETIQSF